MTGLTKDQRVIVSLPGGGTARGLILEVLAKSYRVQLDDGTVERFSFAKVKPESTRKKTAKLEIDPARVTAPIDVQLPPHSECPGYSALRPIPKPEPPEECLAWLAFIRRQPCCNCGATQNIEAHHEGKKGVGQKVRDTLAVPLCRTCHRVYTDTNSLPAPGLEVGVFEGFYTRGESLLLLVSAQERLLTMALNHLEQRDRLEILSKGMAKISGLARQLGRVEEAA